MWNTLWYKGSICGTPCCIKELSLLPKSRFFNPYFFATHCRVPQTFQTLNSGRSNRLNLKYQSFTPSVCKERGIKKFEFVAITQFLCSQKS